MLGKKTKLALGGGGLLAVAYAWMWASEAMRLDTNVTALIGLCIGGAYVILAGPFFLPKEDWDD